MKTYMGSGMKAQRIPFGDEEEKFVSNSGPFLLEKVPLDKRCIKCYTANVMKNRNIFGTQTPIFQSIINHYTVSAAARTLICTIRNICTIVHVDWSLGFACIL
jgi:hypothetical protein